MVSNIKIEDKIRELREYNDKHTKDDWIWSWYERDVSCLLDGLEEIKSAPIFDEIEDIRVYPLVDGEWGVSDLGIYFKHENDTEFEYYFIRQCLNWDNPSERYYYLLDQDESLYVEGDWLTLKNHILNNKIRGDTPIVIGHFDDAFK
jgi:hypothetical protein